MTNGSRTRVHWNDRLGFILAASGSAVGLGNIWKFPYIAGVNGGGAFVLIYLLRIFVIGIPILIAEIYIGRNAQRNTVQAFEVLHRKGSYWRLVGLLGVVSAFLILSFYSVVGGWVLAFEWNSLLNIVGLTQSQESTQNALTNLFANPGAMIVWHTIFMGITIAIVAAGVNRGIERWARILMPLLFLLLIILLLVVMSMGGFSEAINFLFVPHWQELTWSGVLEAVGHSFFTLSLGMGTMITYGSYLRKQDSVINTAFTVAFLDTLIAVVAGIVIFSVVFTFGQKPAVGPTLMFVNIPLLFEQMPGGSIISVIFFLLVTVAAMTSAVSLLEVVVAYWNETKFRVSIHSLKTTTTS